MSLLTLSPDASVEEIEDEIAFTHCLLDTLDKDAEDYEIKRQEHNQALATLQEMIASKLAPEETPGFVAHRASESSATPSQVHHACGGTGDPNWRGDAYNPFLAASFSEDPLDGARTLHSPVAFRQSRPISSQPQNNGTESQGHCWNGPLGPDPKHPPQVTSGSSSLRSSYPLKRKSDMMASPRDLAIGSKLTRMTPSPAGTAPTTPCSTDSMSEIEDKLEQGLREALGIAKNYTRQSALDRQREAENRARARRQREISDAQMARQFQTQVQAWPASQNMSQANLNNYGGFTPKVKPDTEFLRTNTFVEPHRQVSHGLGLAQAQGLMAPSYQSPYETAPSSFKTEAGLWRSYPTPNPSGCNVIDLLGSDSADDDELQEINPASFQPKGPAGSARDSTTKFQSDTASTHPDAALPGSAAMNDMWNKTNLGSSRPAFSAPAPPALSSDSPAALSWLNPGLQSGARQLQALGSMISSNVGAWMDDLTSVNFMMSGSSANGSGLYGTGGLVNPHAAGLGYDFGGDTLDGRSLRQVAVDPMDYLMHNDPAMAARSREDLNRLLENIRPDEDLPPELRGNTPPAMKYPLMEHQKLGLTWLKKMEEGSNKGGILADDMGLGKTIQAIALMVSRKSDDPRRKTTLIVAPVALMRQWQLEIRTKVKGGPHALTVHIHHGQKKKVSFSQLREFDVVLTTFGTLACELKRKQSWDAKKAANPNARPTAADSMALLGDESKWYRVIIDEAQCIKNKSTRGAVSAYHLQSLTRICMTGTPMMNNVGELFSLIHFLRIPPYNSQTKFNCDFKAPLQSNGKYVRDAAMKKLQALLQAILLRRTKKSKIDGQPILNLPERTTEIAHAIFSEDQKGIYDGLERKSQVAFNRYLKAGTVLRNYSNILVLLLRLRQACCHPHLINDLSVADEIATDLSESAMITFAKELKPDVVVRIKAADGSFECPVCYDAVENPAIFYPCGHWSCSECLARLCDPARAMAQGNENSQDAKCPECRAKVNPKSVLDYNAFKEAHMPEHASLGNDGPEGHVKEDEDETESEKESETQSETESGGDGETDEEGSTLGGFIVGDDETASEGDGDGQPRVKEDRVKKEKKHKRRKDRKGKGKMEKEKAPKMTLAQLKKEAHKNKDAKRRYLRRLRTDWVSSAKIDKIMEILKETMENGDEKTIVFSQFTSFLDLVEVPIDREGWTYERYDGSMSATHRNDAVCNFTENPRCRIMLVSLKAGNAGLNLVAASQVIILDPFWNPYIEEQAIDRAHRIGQLRPVTVHRILIEGTVEDRIIALQEKKRQMIETALDEGQGKSLSRLGIQQLSYLFGVSNDMGNGRN